MTQEHLILATLARHGALRGVEITIKSRGKIKRNALGEALKRLADRGSIESRRVHLLSIWQITDAGLRELAERETLKRGQRWRPTRPKRAAARGARTQAAL